jgi:hypothetical protein
MEQANDAARNRNQNVVPVIQGGSLYNRPLTQEEQQERATQLAMDFMPGGVGMTAKVTPKTKFEIAHEVAQRNAAKPISEGGLGLRPDNTAMERARAMGYADDAYRGSPTVNRPEPDVTLGWSSSAPEVANSYTAKNRLRGAEWGEGPSSFSPYVMPLKVRVDRTVDAGGSGWQSVPYGGSYTDINRIASDVSPGGVKVSNVIDMGSGRKQIVADSIASYPGSVRSRFAAFDPARRNEADLLGYANPRLLPWLAGGTAAGIYGASQLSDLVSP